MSVTPLLLSPEEKDRLNMKLRVACANGKPDHITALITQGADAQYVPKAGNPSNLMLSLKARTPTAKKIECLQILAPVSNIEHHDRNGWCAWGLLMWRGDDALEIEECRILAKQLLPWCDLNAEPAKKMTVLSLAMHSLDTELMALAIDAYNGYDTQLREQRAQGALIQVLNASARYSTPEDKLRAIELLVSRGFDVNAPNLQGISPLAFAAHLRLSEIVAYLLQEGADANAKDTAGSTPLMRACVYAAGSADTINLLLPVSDLLHQNKEGQTALMILALGLSYEDDISVFKPALAYLMEHSDVHAKNRENETVWDIMTGPSDEPTPAVKVWLTEVYKAQQEAKLLAKSLEKKSQPSDALANSVTEVSIAKRRL